MTRINADIDPSTLCRQHLLAEERELPRIFTLVRKGKLSENGQPSHFKMGLGHQKFFRDKLLFLNNRYKRIYRECKRRGYNPVDKSPDLTKLPTWSLNDWNAPKEANAIAANRIIERLQGIKRPDFSKAFGN